MPTVSDIARAIEAYAPLRLQEDYDNAGLQTGSPRARVNAVLVCLDVTEEIIDEALRRQCDMIVSHHPLIFRGLKQLTGADITQRLVIRSLEAGVAIYSAHTNLDSARGGVSAEMGHRLGLRNMQPLVPSAVDAEAGLGAVGDIEPTPKMEFLRHVKEKFGVKSLRYSASAPQLVVRKVALCGGAGASFIGDAVAAGADIYITGDLKYHDFTGHGSDIVLADIGHYESELCSRHILQRIVSEAFPDCPVYLSETETNPIKNL